jgi:hypothetical protein
VLIACKTHSDRENREGEREREREGEREKQLSDSMSV